MKVLAVVETDENGRIISETPESIFCDNTSTDEITVFFESVKADKEKLKHFEIEAEKKVEYRRIISENFEQIRKMGFVHKSDFERMFETKFIEMEYRITVRFYFDKVTKKLRNLAWKLVGQYGYQIYKLLQKYLLK